MYFGKNPIINTDGSEIESSGAAADQGWWIAGYQKSGYGDDGNEGALVLLCDLNQPMSISQPFCPDWYDDPKNFGSDWNCMYQGSTPSDVYPNHYGGSAIRAKLQELRTDANRFLVQRNKAC